MVEDLETEVNDLLVKISTGHPIENKKTEELSKNLKEEKEQKEKLEKDKKKLEEQIVKLEAEIKKGNSGSSGKLHQKQNAIKIVACNLNLFDSNSSIARKV